ncbi:hypothetical protein [Parasphingorhabdus sp.]|uniref:hypothetical protein n=1 Tax=Parasphingorhabdus sp. TaxID=2709688 RepID=UPI00359375A4
MRLPIEHVPIDLGLETSVQPNGKLRLVYETDWDDDDESVEEKLIAEFGISDWLLSAIRLEFAGPLIIRVTDETFVSTATDSLRWTGDLTTFAREVRGDDFAAMHSLFFDLCPEAKHLQFVTCCACLDVIAVTRPHATLIKAKAPRTD